MASSKRRRPPVAKPVAATQGDLTNPLALVDTRSGSRYGPTLRYNPDELAGHKGLRVFDKMLRDEQVYACYALKVAAIIGPGWVLEPADETEPARALAELLTDDLSTLPGPLEDALEGILSAVAYGFSLVEQIYTMDEGRMRLKQLQPIAPHDVRFEQDPFGTIVSVQQQTSGMEPLPPGKFIHFVNQAGRQFANPYGTSDLTAAYTPWFGKVHWQQWLNIYGEKLADAPIISRHPKDTQASKISAAQNVLENLQARTVLSVPEGWDVSLLESGGRSPRGTFVEAIEHYNLAIAKALLIPDKLGIVGGEVQAGSLALSKTQLGAFAFVIELMQKRLEAAVNEQLIARMAELAAPGVPAPRFKLLPMTQEDRQAIVTAWLACVAGGMPQLPKDLAHTRGLLDYPEVSEDELRQLQEQAKAEAEEKAERELAARGFGNGGSGSGNGDKAGSRGAATRADMTALPATSVTLPTEPWRELRPSEQRVDLAATRAAFDESATEAGAVLGDIATAIVGDVKAKAAKLLRAGLTPQAVRALRVTTPAATMRKLADPLLEAFRRGVRNGRRDADQGRGITALTAAEVRLCADTVRLAESFSDLSAQTFFQNKAFWVTGVLENDILARAQAVLFNALKAHDKPDRVVLLELDEVLHDYLPVRDAGGRVVNVPTRLENIARTNTAEAVNEGRWAMFTDPEVAPFVDALEYSAILDSRVRDSHRAWDGVVKPVDWWQGPPDRRPPNGWQCRCVLVPIVAGDGTAITPDEALPDMNVVDTGFK